MRPRTDRQTHRRAWPQYISCGLRLTRNVMTNSYTDKHQNKTHRKLSKRHVHFNSDTLSSCLTVFSYCRLDRATSAEKWSSFTHAQPVTQSLGSKHYGYSTVSSQNEHYMSTVPRPHRSLWYSATMASAVSQSCLPHTAPQFAACFKTLTKHEQSVTCRQTPKYKHKISCLESHTKIYSGNFITCRNNYCRTLL